MARSEARAAALGGVLAALAVTLMALGTLIPVATYVCPAACMVLLRSVAKHLGRRMAWAWYGAVALLSALLAPDKEAAVIFAALGYYPIVKPRLDRTRCRWLWKALLFNGATLAAYGLMLYVLGLEQTVRDFSGVGLVLGAALLALGNVVFFLLDRLLGMEPRRR